MIGINPLTVAFAILTSSAPVLALEHNSGGDTASDVGNARQAEATDPARDFDPETVDPADVIQCKISAPHYAGFIMAFTLDGEPGSWDKRGWKKVDPKNAWLTQYRLPAPITVFSYKTDNVVFTNSGMLAVLDIADPHAIAAQNGVEIWPAATRYMGEKILEDKEAVESELEMKIKTKISLNISTVTSHPGKTLIGCSYNTDLEPIDK
jgi:hypothetical protein